MFNRLLFWTYFCHDNRFFAAEVFFFFYELKWKMFFFAQLSNNCNSTRTRKTAKVSKRRKSFDVLKKRRESWRRCRRRRRFHFSSLRTSPKKLIYVWRSPNLQSLFKLSAGGGSRASRRWRRAVRFRIRPRERERERAREREREWEREREYSRLQ